MYQKICLYEKHWPSYIDCELYSRNVLHHLWTVNTYCDCLCVCVKLYLLSTLYCRYIGHWFINVTSLRAVKWFIKALEMRDSAMLCLLQYPESMLYNAWYARWNDLKSILYSFQHSMQIDNCYYRWVCTGTTNCILKHHRELSIRIIMVEKVWCMCWMIYRNFIKCLYRPMMNSIVLRIDTLLIITQLHGLHAHFETLRRSNLEK